MEHLHWVALVIYAGIALTVYKDWDAFKPSVRRTLISVCSILAFVYLIPSSYVAQETTKTTEFCLRCHVMDPYGASLKGNSNEILAEVHFQNNYIPQKSACYDCHVDYGFFRDVRSKFRGLRHLYANHVTGPSHPIKSYERYSNNLCLHCHGSSKRFQENEHHHYKSKPFADINADRVSCMTKGCHEVPHFYPAQVERLDGGMSP